MQQCLSIRLIRWFTTVLRRCSLFRAVAPSIGREPRQSRRGYANEQSSGWSDSKGNSCYIERSTDDEIALKIDGFWRTLLYFASYGRPLRSVEVHRWRVLLVSRCCKQENASHSEVSPGCAEASSGVQGIARSSKLQRLCTIYFMCLLRSPGSSGLCEK